MCRNCATHLQAAIGILQPTLVISQGSGLVETLRGSFDVTHPMSTDLGTNLARCDLEGNQFIWAALQHPTWNWSTINPRYFPGDRRSRYHSGTQAGAEARADGLISAAPTVIGTTTMETPVDSNSAGIGRISVDRAVDTNQCDHRRPSAAGFTIVRSDEAPVQRPVVGLTGVVAQQCQVLAAVGIDGHGRAVAG